MSINPRSQPYRLDPPVEESNLPQIITNADEMFQILFEDIVALDTEIDAVIATAASSSSTSTPGPKGPPGKEGTSGASNFRTPPGGNNTNFVPYVGAVRDVDLGTNTVTTPKVIGGTSTTQSLTLKSTMGVGIAGADIIFQVGNNGATEAMRIVSSATSLGYVGVGTNNPLNPLVVSNTAIAQAKFQGYSSASGSPSDLANGEIILGNTASFQGRIGYDATSAISLFLDNTFDNDLGDIRFRVKTAGTPITGITLKGTGRVGFQVASPSAILHLKAGTATASTAPLKFNSGTLLGTAEAGAVEFLTDAYYGTITTGAARKTFAFLESPAFTGTVGLPIATLTGKVTNYNSIVTTGWGVPAIYGTGRATAQTAANASVATYTVGAIDGSFIVSANVNVTTSTLHNFTVTCSYTDETNTARVQTIPFVQLAGTPLTAITNATGAGPYESMPLHIRCKASTAITIGSTGGGGFTTVTYNIEGSITQIS